MGKNSPPVLVGAEMRIFEWGVALALLTTSLPARAQDVTKYEKLDKAVGWMEFLESVTDDKARSAAEERLRNSLDREQLITSVVTGKGSERCAGGRLTQSELLENIHTVGAKWEWHCDRAQSARIGATNPSSQRSLFVSLEVQGIIVDVIAKAGAKSSDTFALSGVCDSRSRQGNHRFSSGRITFSCSSDFRILAAAPVPTGLEDVLTLKDPADVLKAAGRASGVLAKGLTARAERLRVEQNAKRLSALKSSTKLGTKPSSVADGRPYTLRVSNPHAFSVDVTVRHEHGETVLSVPSKGEATTEFVTNAGAPPRYSLVALSETK
jgi:hypothetical protein